MKLRISDQLALPMDAATQTFAIMGIRGTGKTTVAVDLAEEFSQIGQPFVVYDPTGAWSGIKSSRDGKKPGYPVVIFGGERADVPLEETAGETIARVIVERRVPAILDCSLLRKGARIRFMADFCENLYHLNREALHFFADEAHTIAPQKPQPETARVLGAVEDIVLQGRRRGLGITVISQRPALVNTNIRTQCQTLITLRVIGPHDRRAIQEWTDAHGTPEQARELMASLPTLKVGEGWVWSPAWLNLFKRVHFRDRETFDSSATPEVGKKAVTPKAVAEIDLAALGEQIKATVEAKKANDPAALKKQIADLQKQLAAKPAVEMDSHRERTLLDEIHGLQARVASIGANTRTGIRQLQEMKSAFDGLFGWAARMQLMIDESPLPSVLHKKSVAEYSDSNKTRVPAPQSRPALKTIASGSSDAVLGRMPRALLTAIAQHPDGLNKQQIYILAGYTQNGSTSRAFAQFVAEGWCEMPAPHTLRITEAGLAALGDFDPLPKGEALRNLRLHELPQMERAMLSEIFEAYPEGITKQALYERTNYTQNGSTSRAFAKFVRLGWATMPAAHTLRAADFFFEE